MIYWGIVKLTDPASLDNEAVRAKKDHKAQKEKVSMDPRGLKAREVDTKTKYFNYKNILLNIK